MTGLAGDLLGRQIIGDQIHALPPARDFVALGDMAVGALDTRRRVDIVVRAEGIAAFRATVQDALIDVTQRLGGRVMRIGVAAHVVLMTAQTVLGADRPDGQGGAQAAILIPA